MSTTPTERRQRRVRANTPTRPFDRTTTILETIHHGEIGSRGTTSRMVSNQDRYTRMYGRDIRIPMAGRSEPVTIGHYLIPNGDEPGILMAESAGDFDRSANDGLVLIATTTIEDWAMSPKTHRRNQGRTIVNATIGSDEVSFETILHVFNPRDGSWTPSRTWRDARYSFVYSADVDQDVLLAKEAVDISRQVVGNARKIARLNRRILALETEAADLIAKGDPADIEAAQKRLARANDLRITLEELEG